MPCYYPGCNIANGYPRETRSLRLYTNWGTAQLNKQRGNAAMETHRG